MPMLAWEKSRTVEFQLAKHGAINNVVVAFERKPITTVGAVPRSFDELGNLSGRHCRLHAFKQRLGFSHV